MQHGNLNEAFARRPRRSGRIAQAFVGLAVPLILFMTTPGFSASSDDTDFPIGRIDAQIACLPIQRNPTGTEGGEEPTCLAEFHDAVTRAGDDLTFKLDNGKTKLVHSNRKECEQLPIGDCYIYKLVGYIPTSRQFVLRQLAYEAVFVTLVSRRTGATTNLEGYPRLSPDGTRFITVAGSDAWDIKFPIAIYLNTDPPTLEWRFPDPPEYEEYSFDGWDGENRAKVRTVTDPQIDTDVRRTATGWILKRPHGKVYAAPSAAAHPLSQIR